MTEEEFLQLIAFGRETRGVEFKGPGARSDRHLQARVIRAMLSMANNRDGGLVVVGVDEDDAGNLVTSGLSPDECATWSFDHLADATATYADPSVQFDLEAVDSGGRSFIVIQVHEFEDIPVLCKRDFPNVLRDGACYVRTRRKPETVEIPSQTEMRDLLDLATEKALRKHISINAAAGIAISVGAQPEDDGKFRNQLIDLLED